MEGIKSLTDIIPFWQGQKDLNPQPTVLETATLPIELYPYNNQRLPILPGGLPPSTFGVCGLNCCVRHGNRWIPAAIATEFLKGPCPYNCIKRTSLTSLRSAYGSFLRTCFQIPSPTPFGSKRLAPVCASLLSSFKQGSLLKSSPRSISTGPLRASLHFHSRPIYHVVFMGPYLLSQ